MTGIDLVARMDRLFILAAIHRAEMAGDEWNVRRLRRLLSEPLRPIENA